MKKKKQKQEYDYSLMEIIWICLIFSSIGFIIGLLVYDYIIDDDSSMFSSSNTDFEEDMSRSYCKNLSISDTTRCLRNYMKTFYNYTERSENKYVGDQGSFEDIIKNGGDCYDYSNMYRDMAKELGFHSKGISFFPDDGAGHRITIIWAEDMSEYCVVDMMHILDCVKLNS